MRGVHLRDVAVQRTPLALTAACTKACIAGPTKGEECKMAAARMGAQAAGHIVAWRGPVRMGANLV